MTSPYPGNTHWPAHWQACTLTGTYVNADGTIPVGHLTLTPAPDVVMVPMDNITVVPDPITITLDNNGHFSHKVPATDDPDITPNGWTYTVEESWENGRTYNIVAPVGQTWDITRAAPMGKFMGVLITQGRPGELTLAEADARYVRTVNGIGPDSSGDVEVVGSTAGAVSSSGSGSLLLTTGSDLTVSSDGAGTLTMSATGSFSMASDSGGDVVITV